MRSAGPVLAFLVLMVAGCTVGAEGSSPTSGPADENFNVRGTTTTKPCEPEVRPLQLSGPPGTDPAGLVALSKAVYSCMPAAVVVQGDDVATVRYAAVTALERAVPLLRMRGGADRDVIAEELERLGVSEVVTIAVDPALSSGLADSVKPQSVPTTLAPTTTIPTTIIADSGSTSESTDSLEEETATTTTTTTTVETSTTTSPGGVSSTVSTAEATTTTVPPPRFDPPELTEPASAEGPVVLYREDAVADAYFALPAISAGGGQVAVVNFDDVDGVRALLDGRTNVVVGGAPTTPTEKWQIALAATATELFGGGTQVFPDRRIIAYYGNPLTFRLGLLGETDPDRAVERVTERAALYDAEGLPPAQPGFEIIATVASNRAGDDENYSNEMDVEVLRPWIDTALANGVSVILDLQPGRSDFVSQAKLYEEFLRLPNVGLALDPEWRLEPDQRHLRQIGSVGAEEVNSVIDYLTTLVHEETLPQKVLILHQFQERMLPDRELVKTPPEIAVVVHVDGQGSLGSKYGTWAAMLNATTAPDQQLWWAWKNFIDEDFPTATPGQVNAVDPLPVIVTYQ